MYGLDDYVFVNEDFEMIGSAGFRDDEAAEKQAEYLSKQHKCAVECYKLVTKVEAPESEDEDE